ncbi:TonB-dependent receptor [Thalassotalea sp. LPB0316]|uniref:TonB-dependent receptor plug domain-containing protein n=1 Tax=Thalassotalea sp. LPB0316 TaxID=2769490 RepID=UPI0018691A24|nr:TonB-dependent receptor [Thalassotalea sp. LPB0316]QOL25301.1 TonB-dependent receptor [Thalassotalea sp. LPB0316]
MKTPAIILPVLVNLAVCASVPALGQNNNSEVERIAVTGSRYQKQLVTSNNQQLIEQDIVIQPNSLADWLADVPGVSLNGQGGQFQSYSIRGFSKARIKTEINGTPILTDRRAGNSVAFLPNEFIDTIDVRKGPSASYYGSDAMGGVVSAQLKHFDGTFLQANYQPNNDAKSLVAGYGNERFSIGGGYQDANNNTAPNGDKLNTSFDKRFAIASLKQSGQAYELTANAFMSQARNIAKSSSQYPDERITEYPFDDHVLVNVSLDHRAFGRWQIGLHDQAWQSDILRVQTRQNITDYQAKTYHLLWQDDFVGIFGVDTSHSDFALAGTWGVEWTKRADVNIYEREYSIGGDAIAEGEVVNAEQNNYAIFVHQYGQFNDWSWGLSGRVDKLKQWQQTTGNKVDDNYFSASFSVNKSFSQHLNFQAEVGNGFRFASLSERYFNGETPRGTIIGNQDLLPEESVGGQLGVTYHLNHAISVDLNAYRYWVDHYIERIELDEQTLSYTNVDSAEIYGAEASIEWQQNTQFVHRVHFQYNRGTSENGSSLNDLNPDDVSWHSIWQWRNWRVSNQLGYRFAKHAFGSAERELESAFLWHVNGQYQVSNNWQINVYLQNLTNELYRATADQDAPWQPERSIAISVKYQR